MKNMLISVASVLILVFVVLVAVKGITIGGFEILSVSQISDKYKKLDGDINEVNELSLVTYKNNISELDDSTKKLSTAKASYLDAASLSTDEEIKKANQDESYSMEYLWSKIGNHATEQGVNLKLEVKSTGIDNKNNLSFLVKGSYVPIRNFVYNLENDKDLNFRIENFKITYDKTNGASNLECTFNVLDVGIKIESINSGVDDSNIEFKPKIESSIQEDNKLVNSVKTEGN